VRWLIQAKAEQPTTSDQNKFVTDHSCNPLLR